MVVVLLRTVVLVDAEEAAVDKFKSALSIKSRRDLFQSVFISVLFGCII